MDIVEMWSQIVDTTSQLTSVLNKTAEEYYVQRRYNLCQKSH